MKRIAITGTSRGLGRALAAALADQHVITHARHGADVTGDLRDPTLGPRIAAAAHALGGLDVLILNAGMLGEMVPLAATDFTTFREVMEVNVDAQLRIVVACLPELLRARGAVIWLTSYLGHAGLEKYNAYCASKHALEGLMKVLAAEHAGSLVSVAVSPGMTETDMLQAAIGPHDPTSFKTPAQTAAQFVRLIEVLGPELNGQSVEIDAVVGSPATNG